MKKYFLIILALGLSNIVFAETQEFDLSTISKIKVNNTSGELRIMAVETGKARVSADKIKFGKNCKLTIEQRERTLFVEVKNTKIFSRDECEVNLSIHSPKSASLELNAGSGNLHIEGTRGDLSYNVGSGNVDVIAEVKKLDGKSGSGDVSIKGLTSGGNIKAGSGRINLVYTSSPEAGELSIRTGSGSTDLSLPKIAKIKTSFMAGSGELTNELGDSPESKFKISMQSGSGNLHIKKN